MPKPATLPEWNMNQAAPNTVAPAAGVKTDGVAPGDKLPAQWLNWVLSWLYKWAEWLDVFLDVAHTWTDTQTHVPDPALGDDAAAVVISTTAASTYHLQETKGEATSTVKHRWFLDSSGGRHYTVNAYWDPAGVQWMADDAGQLAVRYRFTATSGRYFVDYHAPAANWADAAWTLGQVDIDAALGKLTTTGQIIAGTSVTATNGNVTAGGTVVGDAGPGLSKFVRSYSTGTVAAAGQFSLDPQWGGVGAGVGSFAGNDSAGAVTVTAGAGPGASPSFVFTFKDGTWTNSPQGIVAMANTNDGTAAPVCRYTVTATAMTVSLPGFTPTAGKIYTFRWKFEGV